MYRLHKFTSALALASFVALGMVAFGPTVQAQGRGPGTGGGNSNFIICSGLSYLYNSALSAGLTVQADEIKSYAASIPCDWAL